MAMSTAINAPEDFVLSKSISGTKFVKALKRVLLDSFGQTDSASLKEDLADALDIEVEDIPTLNVQIVATVGKTTTSVSGLEAEETEEEDD
jgi:hypothetical protein